MKVIIKAMFVDNNEKVSVTIFDDELRRIVLFTSQQTTVPTPFEDLSEEEIMEFVLTMKATVHCDDRTVIFVKSKDD